MNNISGISFLICFVIFFISCLNQPAIPNYELVWSEEFEGTSLDTTIWKFWEGPAYNDELQFYTSRPENAYLENGHLFLQANRESYEGKEYTSARISTDSTRIGWEKGRFEARIKMPAGQGLWPAFWLMPIRDKGWPRSGEIDIMEYRGNEPSVTTGAVHFWQAGCDESPWECRRYLTDSYTLPEGSLGNDFHLYSLEWTDNELIWFLDETEFHRVAFEEIEAEFEPFTGPFYIILNLAVGGNFLPDPDESTEFPQALVVDYVRVYQRE
ncbi:MAG: glycoside hydrolase family 16 protein [Balneolaceae bacterium]